MRNIIILEQEDIDDIKSVELTLAELLPMINKKEITSEQIMERIGIALYDLRVLLQKAA